MIERFECAFLAQVVVDDGSKCDVIPMVRSGVLCVNLGQRKTWMGYLRLYRRYNTKHGEAHCHNKQRAEHNGILGLKATEQRKHNGVPPTIVNRGRKAGPLHVRTRCVRCARHVCKAPGNATGQTVLRSAGAAGPSSAPNSTPVIATLSCIAGAGDMGHLLRILSAVGWGQHLALAPR